jgi:hypothetical protein
MLLCVTALERQYLRPPVTTKKPARSTGGADIGGGGWIRAVDSDGVGCCGNEHSKGQTAGDFEAICKATVGVRMRR